MMEIKDKSELAAAISQRALDYHWSLFATSSSNTDIYIDSDGINISVNRETGEFNLKAMVKHSVFKIDLDGASSFTDEKHFLGLYDQITNMVRTLNGSPLSENWWHN